jgi:uncharacterized protein YndB with AHSA1/START domain
VSRVNVKVAIQAPIERVWETVMDPHQLGQWVTIHRSVKQVSDLPMRRGAEMEQTLQIRGVPFHVHWTLVDVDPPRAAEWRGRGPAHSRASIRYELSAVDGTTVFEYSNEFTAPGGRLGNVASRVIVGAASEREASTSLARLKKLLENG